MSKIVWLDDVEEHDYPAAAEYLSLTYGSIIVSRTIYALKRETIRTYKAKDVIRASQLPLLPRKDASVAKDFRKIKDGDALSPILLVRAVPLIVADGYHRVCASYWVDENTEIPCRIADLAGR